MPQQLVGLPPHQVLLMDLLLATLLCQRVLAQDLQQASRRQTEVQYIGQHLVPVGMQMHCLHHPMRVAKTSTKSGLRAREIQLQLTIGQCWQQLTATRL